MGGRDLELRAVWLLAFLIGSVAACGEDASQPPESVSGSGNASAGGAASTGTGASSPQGGMGGELATGGAGGRSDTGGAPPCEGAETTVIAIGNGNDTVSGSQDTWMREAEPTTVHGATPSCT